MRGFDAGKLGRRLRAIPSTALAINSQITRYGRTIVARSRYLAANNPYAAAAKDAYVSAMVGGGIKPSSLVADDKLKLAVNKAWRTWTDEADADQVTDFYGLQTLIASEMFEAGECFVRLRPRLLSDGFSVPLQLQLLPSEMLDVTHNEIVATGRIQNGVEFDKLGRRVAYWFYRNMPNELMQYNVNGNTKYRISADQILHLFKPIRAGQIRGVPHTLAGMVTLAMLDLYDDAELERKRVAALFGAFITRQTPGDSEVQPFDGAETTDHVDERGQSSESIVDYTLEPGAMVELPEGTDIKFAEPADVGGSYEMFQLRMLLRAAAGFQVPYADMTGDLRQTSYGSIRAGLVAFRRRIEAQQHQVMVFQFCRPVRKAWFRAAVLAKAIDGLSATAFTARPFFYMDTKWIPPKWEWIDPLKDRQAEKLAVDSGFKPRSDVIEAEGYDPEEVDNKIKADQDRAAKLGIRFITLKTEVIISPSDDEDAFANPAAPKPPPAPANDNPAARRRRAFNFG